MEDRAGPDVVATAGVDAFTNHPSPQAQNDDITVLGFIRVFRSAEA